MLTGLFPPSKGGAYVNGKSVSRQPYALAEEQTAGEVFHSTPPTSNFQITSDMMSIHSEMGVCPQHDVLWNDLTAEEHLLFYGRLKGFSGNVLNKMVKVAMDSVQLGEHRAKLVGMFSGGMKRRLSCACSLIGNPSIVYMDEPSTGLDPASRHRLWSVIQQAKGNKSIVLTTHSMEQADVLCERIAIMSDGFLQCIGTGSELKLRFGEGYTVGATLLCNIT